MKENGEMIKSMGKVKSNNDYRYIDHCRWEEKYY